MSSKSRNQPKKPAAKASPPAPSATPAAASSTKHHGLEIPDEYLHAPKEVSKLRFALMVGLVVVLLVIFIVPSAIQNLGRADSGQAPMVTWVAASGEEVAVSAIDFTTEKRRFDDALRMDMFLAFMLGITEGRIDDESTLRILVLDDLAKDAGILVTDNDLKAYLKEVVERSFGNDPNAFKGYTQRMGGVKVAEETLRQLLAAKRYLDLLGHVAAVPDPAKIEEFWGEEHRAFAFDYAQAKVADFEAPARAELPDDAGLEAWYAGLSEEDRAAFLAPERRRASVVSFGLDGRAAPALLVAAYPPAELLSPDEQAQNYFNRVSFIRFRRPPADPAGEAGEEPPPSPYYGFDEVKATCLVEAPVYYALEAWLETLRARIETGETVDLCAEAALQGLDCFSAPEAVSLADYGMALEPLGGETLAIQVFNTGLDQLSLSVQVTEKSLSFLRVEEIRAPEARAFTEVREQVVEAWVQDRARELAVQRLEALRDGFPELATAAAEEGDATEEPQPETAQDAAADEPQRSADEAAFRAAVEGAGLAVARRDWLDRADPFTGDPDKDQPAHVFLRAQAGYYDLADGEVPAPALDAARDYVYLVRKVGEQDLPITKMTPSQYQSYKARTAGAVRGDLDASMRGQAFEERYGVLWRSQRDTDAGDEDLDLDLGDDGEPASDDSQS